MARFRLSDLAIGIVCGPILCCWIAMASCCCPGALQRRRHMESEDKRRFERRQRMAPKPMVARRAESSLTIPEKKEEEDEVMEIRKEEVTGEGEEHSKGGEIQEAEVSARGRGKEKRTFYQSYSPLMRLPLELRQMIYRYVLGDGTMHMVLKEGKLGHLRCKAPSALECPLGFNGRVLSRECCWGTFDFANIWVSEDGAEAGTDAGIVDMLRCCRQIYSESIFYLYSTNTFSFSDLDCLRHFNATTLPQRFSLIRTLDIEWCMTWPIYDPVAQTLLLVSPSLYPPHDEATWEETWRIIATKMPGLKFIRVSLLYFDGFRDLRCEARMLRPLWAVRSVARFEVHVSWQGEDVGLEGAPFRLIRPAVGEEDGEDEMS